MAAATSPQVLRKVFDASALERGADDPIEPLPLRVTLLELVEAVSAVADDEHEVVATVISMLTHRRVRLGGNFRDEALKDFED